MARAMPKSMTTTRPARVSITFSGLMSRCTSPAVWIASSPARNCEAISRASWSSSGLRSRSRIGQRHPVDELHRHQLPAVELDQVEDAADVWRDHFAGRADFLAQAVERPLVGQQRHPHGLERHVDPQLEIEGAKDLAHAAASEQRADAIAVAEHMAGGERLDRLDDGWVARPWPGLRFR